MSRRILDIGCGKDKVKDAIGLDCCNLPGVDVVHDLTAPPYPFADNYFDEVHCNHVLEHLDNIIPVMEEIYRISKNGAMVFIRVPHASCSMVAWTDPTHKRAFACRSFSYFSSKSQYGYYSKANYEVVKTKLHYSLFDGIASRIPRWWQFTWNTLANFNSTTQKLWERVLANYIGGFEELYVELKVVKDE